MSLKKLREFVECGERAAHSWSYRAVTVVRQCVLGRDLFGSISSSLCSNLNNPSFKQAIENFFLL